jgi:hypothetical protein
VSWPIARRSGLGSLGSEGRKSGALRLLCAYVNADGARPASRWLTTAAYRNHGSNGLCFSLLTFHSDLIYEDTVSKEALVDLCCAKPKTSGSPNRSIS